VGPRGAWKTPEHPFRSAPLKLTGQVTELCFLTHHAPRIPALSRSLPSLCACSIPTLVALSPDGSEVSRLGPELEACANEEQAEELLKTFAG
jgi:hypothetical protein